MSEDRGRALKRVLALAAIHVAARSPELRGPFVFDEVELQRIARGARTFLRSIERDGEAQ